MEEEKEGGREREGILKKKEGRDMGGRGEGEEEVCDEKKKVGNQCLSQESSS